MVGHLWRCLLAGLVERRHSLPSSTRTEGRYANQSSRHYRCVIRQRANAIHKIITCGINVKGKRKEREKIYTIHSNTEERWTNWKCSEDTHNPVSLSTCALHFDQGVHLHPMVWEPKHTSLWWSRCPCQGWRAREVTTCNDFVPCRIEHRDLLHFISINVHLMYTHDPSWLYVRALWNMIRQSSR